VYFGGGYAGTVDFDPGSARSLLSNSSGAQAFVAKLDANGTFGWARGISGGTNFSGYALALSASAQGPVWVAGVRQGPCTFGDQPPQGDAGSYVAAFQANADLVGEWTVAPLGSDVRSVSAAVDGSVFVGGYQRVLDGGDIDLNPGAGVDKRGVVPGNTGFAMKLAADGSYVWGQLLGFDNVTVAATPDGGMLATGFMLSTGQVDDSKRFVSKLRADGSSAWSLGYFAAGDGFRLAAGKNRFIVAGVVDHGDMVDFNPFSPVESGFVGQTTFFSRYSY
jgi:hypothetical protein